MINGEEFLSTMEAHFLQNEYVRAFAYCDYSVEMHSHDFYEVNIVLAGKGTHNIEDYSVEVRAGDVFVIPPWIIHGYSNTEKLDVFHILLRPQFINNNKNETRIVEGFAMLTEIEPFVRGKAANPTFLHLSPDELMNLVRGDIKLIDDGNTHQPAHLLPIKYHTVWKILYTFSHLLIKQMSSGKRKIYGEYETAIMRALEYIHTHYSEKITIKMLCDEVFLSRSTFLRNFGDVCRCTPNEYIANYRKKIALAMLDEGKYSKKEVANRCGFYDHTHMDKMLKKSKEL